jgi:hypothetical protein
MINLEKHKTYIESHKMDMVPYSVAVQAIQEILDTDAGKYATELEEALNDLQNSINDLNLDD